jgi:hypothetical protein
MKASLPLLLVACAACSSARIAGGAIVAPGSEPSGFVLSLYGMGRCEDETGARVPEPEARVSLVQLRDGRIVLVERRPGYDSLVVDNGWDEGETRVFQLALKRTDGVPYLREYRLPRSGSDFGQLALVDRVAAWGDTRNGFHAIYRRPSLSCALRPYGS